MNTDDHMVVLEITQPVVAEMHYATCSAIDRHNRRSCDDIKLEKNLVNKSWEKRANLRIFGVSVVDTYNVATQSLYYEDTSHLFFCNLDE